VVVNAAMYQSVTNEMLFHNIGEIVTLATKHKKPALTTFYFFTNMNTRM
jgi:hypothetical protein